MAVFERVEDAVFVLIGVLTVVFRARFARSIIEGQNFNFRARLGERDEWQIRRVVVIVGVGMVVMALVHAITDW